MMVISRPYECSRDVIVAARCQHTSHIRLTRLFASFSFSRSQRVQALEGMVETLYLKLFGSMPWISYRRRRTRHDWATTMLRVILGWWRTK